VHILTDHRAIGVLAEQPAVQVIDEVNVGAGGGFVDPLAEGVVDIAAERGGAAGDLGQSVTGVVGVGLGALADGIAVGVVAEVDTGIVQQTVRGWGSRCDAYS
jgi:hypothetical protein